MLLLAQGSTVLSIKDMREENLRLPNYQLPLVAMNIERLLETDTGDGDNRCPPITLVHVNEQSLATLEEDISTDSFLLRADLRVFTET